MASTPSWHSSTVRGILASACASLAMGCAVSAVDVAADVEDEAYSAPAITSELLVDLPPGPAGMANLIVLDGVANSDGTLGAGCQDEESTQLPDGAYFGYLIEFSDTAVTFDVACMFSESSAQWQIYQDSLSDDATATNYVVVNDVVIERTLPVGDEARVHVAAQGWEGMSVAQAVAIHEVEGGIASTGLWLVVKDGSVVAAVEPLIVTP